MPNYKTMHKDLKFSSTVLLQYRDKYNVIVLPSGAWVIYRNDSSSNTKEIIVDINGSKNPNIIGIDLFYLYFLSSGKLIFKHTNSNTGDVEYEVNKTRTQLLSGNNYSCSNYGFWCGALIQADGWHISKDYPWR
jgi:hypothetical protein